MNESKNILITGGTGSLGAALVKRWYGKHKLTVLSRDPHKQVTMKSQYPDIRFILADICDYERIWTACVGQDILIHAAALKMVDEGEIHPGEYARVNIEGSNLTAQAWDGLHGDSQDKRAILISSDKAINAENCYGATKAVSERIFRSFGLSCLRYGNVFGSKGSFIHQWRRRLKKDEPIMVRTPHPTRFVLALDQAVDLVEDALSQPPGIYVPHSLLAFDIFELARHMAIQVELGTIQEESLLPGEKQHESLINEREIAISVSDLLAEVGYGVGKVWGMKRELFNSGTAKRIPVEDLMRWLDE